MSNRQIEELIQGVSEEECQSLCEAMDRISDVLGRSADHGAERLFIISNSKLKPAIHIYEKYGFREIKLDDYEYVRGDIAFERGIREKSDSVEG